MNDQVTGLSVIVDAAKVRDCLWWLWLMVLETRFERRSPKEVNVQRNRKLNQKNGKNDSFTREVAGDNDGR